MDWLQRINMAIDVMEQHMADELNLEEIAQVVHASPFHFQRMFYMLTGMTVAEYMRKRRMTLAAHELSSASARVMDVAMKYGYDSPESFTKAFRKIHGTAPSKVRQSNIQLKAFPRITFEFSICGTEEVEYRIVEIEAFTVVGKSTRTKCEQDNRLHFWQECRRDGTIDKLNSLNLYSDRLGITLDIGEEQFTYMIAVQDNASAVLDGLSTVIIPAMTWAVFTAVGPIPQAIQSLIKRIYQEWFPATGYVHSGGPELEIYPRGDSLADDYRCEVWIPVVKRS